MSNQKKEQFGRIKGASWFPFADQAVLVLGQGGIGSWLTLYLSRIGAEVTTFDGDIFETHNMTGQFVKQNAIGKNKAVAVAEAVKEFNDGAKIYPEAKMFTEDSPVDQIMMCGFDNMKARKLAFDKWVEALDKETPALRKTWIFIDGRCLAEQIQIYVIPGDRKDLIEKYRAEALFTDDQAAAEDCTFKQTSHMAGMIATYMVAFYTNWLANVYAAERRKVPYFQEVLSSINLVNKLYVTIQQPNPEPVHTEAVQ